MQLLRNRVAMLQREQEKANKKIKDTGKKTDELIQRKEINDRHYNQVIFSERLTNYVGAYRARAEGND